MMDRSNPVRFHYQDGLIYRTWRPHGSEEGSVWELVQLVLSKECRAIVLHLAHEVQMAGHLGVTTTKNQILQRYYCGADLPADHRMELHRVMMEYPSIFQANPGRMSLAGCEIHTGDVLLVRQKPHRIPYAKKDVVKKELETGTMVIRPSVCPWASPIVLVPKDDGSIRYCVDYRKLNAKANFDAYPMSRVEEMFESVGAAN